MYFNSCIFISSVQCILLFSMLQNFDIRKFRTFDGKFLTDCPGVNKNDMTVPLIWSTGNGQSWGVT